MHHYPQLSKKMCKKTLTFYITARCNLSCAYCYEPKDSQPEDMTCAMIEKNLKAFMSQHYSPYAIFIFGGEPTLRWDLCEFIFLIKEQFPILINTRIILFTNGILLTFRHLLQMMDAGCEVYLSFDGFGESSRFRYGRHLSSYIQQMILVFEYLKTRPDLTTIVFTIGAQNINSAQMDMQRIYHEYGFFQFKINILRKNSFCASRASYENARRKTIEWARATPNTIKLEWPPWESFGSSYENWYISSRAVVVQQPGVYGYWENVQW